MPRKTAPILQVGDALPAVPIGPILPQIDGAVCLFGQAFSGAASLLAGTGPVVRVRVRDVREVSEAFPGRAGGFIWICQMAWARRRPMCGQCWLLMIAFRDRLRLDFRFLIILEPWPPPSPGSPGSRIGPWHARAAV